VFSQRYRVLVYDRRGTGRSSSPDGDWSAADLSNDLAHLLDALAIERAIVGGSSLGGVITAQFAVDHPERVLALIIGHTVPYLDDVGRAWLEQQVADARAGRPVIARQPASPATAGGPPGPEPPGGWPTTDPAFAASPLGHMIATTGTGLGRTREDVARAIAVLRDWDQRPRKGDLAGIKVPTLVIVGEREPRATIDGSREWASWIPGAEFVVLPGAHHAAPREAAPAWNAAVQGFLDRHGLGGQSTR
ncbi:MAG TPA: alpha/beta fold hydrolase, partial [Candidatus Limnocylindria bacterium]|nr:alpha/beta fold hydrolase [Candidatus Limnocylindria bacterium]